MKKWGESMGEKAFKLLIVDDEENILNGLKNYIGKHTKVFSKIYCTSNGQEALDMIYQHHPDVMLLDVQMPIKNGIEVMREARAANVCPKTILLSGYDNFEYVREALRQGAVDYLLKPSRSTEILEKLESIVVPMQSQKQDSESSGNAIVNRAKEYIKDHIAEDLNLSTVADAVGVSNSYLSTMFTQKLGCGFIDFLNRTRIECACMYMYDNRMKIYEIAFKVGFRDEKYFSKVFKKVTGQCPTSYKAKLERQSD